MRPAAPVHPAAAPEVEEVLGDVVHAAPLGTLRTHTHTMGYMSRRRCLLILGKKTFSPGAMKLRME